MIRLLATYLRPYRAPLVLVVALLLVAALANLYLPELNADIINNGVAKGDTDYILQTGVVMLGVTVLLGIVSIIAVYWSAKVSMSFGRDVRSAIFRAVESFSQVEVNHFGTASLITRNTNDVQQVQMVVLMGLTVMVSAPIMMIGGLIMALRQDVPLTGLLLVIVPIMIVIIGLLVRRAMPLFGAMQKKIDRINQVMRETLAGVRVIRAFVRTDYEERRFDEANRDLFATALSVNRLFAIMMATFMFVIVPRAAVSSGRIAEVLATEPSIHDPARPVSPPRTGRVEFRDVEFRYPGAQEPVLRAISFTAGPGETTAIVGSTGSGKSTLVNLLPRLYDVTGGSLLVDGVDVREMDRADLWGRIGLIPQRAFLFGGTVASNLRVGDEAASDEELWRALEIAQGREFVEEMPEGLDAPIAQGGTNVSGGQRQRLAIARALVKRPPIYVFDDSFSALDFRTDARLRAALHRDLADATVIIVAQRVGTILHADRIVVLDDGGVAGIGTHLELMASCATYREIVLSQLSEEEVA